MLRKSQKISLLITCYNEAGSILELVKRIEKVFEIIPYDFEIIFVDNASSDNSYSLFKKLTKDKKFIKVIIMSRNFHSPQPSIVAGLKYAKGDAVIFLHGDMQDPPELIPKFIEKWKKGYQVVYGIRVKRNGYGLVMNFFYKFFYFILQKLSYISIPLHAGDFSLIDKVIIEEIRDFDEYDFNLRGIRAFVGFQQVGIPYVRDARIHGKSTENFFSSIWWAKTLLVNFSLRPLEWISTIAFLVMLSTFMLLIINVILYFFYQDSPRGIPTIIFVILFLGGVQLLSLSVIAEYLAKIFLEIKKRPRYVIKETFNLYGKILKDRHA